MELKRLEHYFYLSFAVSALLWGFLFWANPDFFNKGFFTSLFLIGSFIVWSSAVLKNNLPMIFLFQSVCLIGAGFEFSEPATLILSLIPLLSGFYFLPLKKQKLQFIGFFLISLFFFKIIYKTSPFGLKESISFFLTFSWASGVILGRFDEIRENSKVRYLFHDLYNFTHGLSLFLSNKKKKGLTPVEINGILHEVESMQSLIGERFKMKSKPIIEVSEIESTILSFGEQFLSKAKINIKKIGDFEKGKISQNEFLRAIGNILKNVYDSKASFCEILIEDQEKGISIIVKNDFSEDLKNKGTGLGLKSTQEILEKIGGLFCFYGENNLWVSRIFIPYLEPKKKAA